MKKILGLTGTQTLLLTGAALFNFLIYCGGRTLAHNLPHNSLAISLDQDIPFLPWMILIYWGCYLFWGVNYVIGVKYDKGDGWRFIRAHFIGECFCFFCFVLYPTTMTRAQVRGSSLAEQIVRLTYVLDAADNLFPSIHCFVSWLCWIGVRNNERIPHWYRWNSFIFAFMICVSTLTVKQHVLADVFAGIVLAELSYRLAGAGSPAANVRADGSGM